MCQFEVKVHTTVLVFKKIEVKLNARIKYRYITSCSLNYFTADVTLPNIKKSVHDLKSQVVNRIKIINLNLLI